MSHLHGKFVWFEHLSQDLESAARFYQGLFGWRDEAIPGEAQHYRMLVNGRDGIGALRQAPPGEAAQWLAYLSVSNIDACCDAALKAGGQVLAPPTDFLPIGRGALIADTQGLMLSLWHSNQGDRSDTAPVANGDWYWNELLVPDPDAALPFYRDVFDYGFDTLTRQGGRCYVLKRGGQRRTGLRQLPPGESLPYCLPSVRVADCDASARLAERLGARIKMAPADLPGIGRFAVLVDPSGASLALLHGNH